MSKKKALSLDARVFNPIQFNVLMHIGQIRAEPR